jgi:hypothetical protein
MATNNSNQKHFETTICRKMSFAVNGGDMYNTIFAADII